MTASKDKIIRTREGLFSCAHAVTKSDSTVLPATRGVFIGGAGNLAVTMADGDTPVVFMGCLAGTILPISVTQVLDTSTTATNILALYESR